MIEKINPINLEKCETFIGLGHGRYIHVKHGGTVEEGGRRTIPAYVSLLYPLIAELIPEEFETTGRFPDKAELERRLEGIFPGYSANDIYDNVGANLAREGIRAKDVAKVLLNLSPLKKDLDTGAILKDAGLILMDGLTRKIVEHYPGSKNVIKKRNNPIRLTDYYPKRKSGKTNIPF